MVRAIAHNTILPAAAGKSVAGCNSVFVMKNHLK